MASRLSFWFRKKYSLSPIDPRFLDLTLAQIEAEYWAYHYLENPAKEEIEDDEFDEESELAEIEARALEREKEREAEQGPPDPGDWEDIGTATE